MSLYALVDPLIQRFPPHIQTRILEWKAMYVSVREASGFVSFPIALARMLLFPRKRVLCTRFDIRRGMVLSKLFAVNGYRPVFEANRRHHFSVRVPTPDNCPVFNGRHVDNQKTRVAAAWAVAAQYELAVDPTIYEGEMVEKSDNNATHDGRVVRGPVSPDEIAVGKVYQRLIDNSDDEEVVDLRVPLYRGRVPFVYIKRRPLNDRFSNTNTSVEIRETAEIFSNDELQALARFAWEAGLDFGEADVLRDKATGRIYVVDSTNGPAGPPNGLPPEQARQALMRLAKSIDEAVKAAIEDGSLASFGS
jgi:hypothetical protein